MSSSSVPPVNRANHLGTMDTFIPVTVGRLNNCNNTLCYTYNHSYVYKPHTGYGQVGTSAASYLASRKRL
jgi:hypothetical protein